MDFWVEEDSENSQREDYGDVKCPGILMVAFRLCLFPACVKFINWYFSGANFTPCFFAHSLHMLCFSSNIWQLSSVELDHVSILVSSTNPTADLEEVWSNGKRVLTKTRNKIRDRAQL